MDLLGGSSSDSEAEDVLNVDNEYAARYDNWRGKEHLQKLKDKYGDKSHDGPDDETDSSSDEEEDENAEELTAQIEKDFFTTLSSLKRKDPDIYDGSKSFFTAAENELSKDKPSEIKAKKITIADMERKVMLEKDGNFEDIDKADTDNVNENSRSYHEEMKSIKDSFKNAFHSQEDEDDSDGLLTRRKKTLEETKQEEEDYKQWLAGQKNDVEDDSLKKKMSGLREYWNESQLDEGEKFLKDYILNKRYLDQDNDEYVPSYDEIVHDSDEDLSEDERNVEKQEEFEHKFNFRFEEPDEEFIKRYPRTVKDSLRREDDKRKKKRKEVEERKKYEKEQKKEEIKMLKNMKKKEIMDKLEKLKQITGNDDMEMDEDDIEGDFDPEKYDKKMKEIFQNYDDDLQVDEEKPTFSDLEDDEFDDNYGEDFEDWDNWTGGKGGDQDEAYNEGNDGDYEAHCEDEDFNMDCDYQQEIVESTKKKKGRRKSKFAQALETNTSKPVFNPSDKSFSEYVDEYYKLDCEDLIGDLPCRFRYRNVQQNDFGLSVEEVLSAEDKELNAWVSLRKTCQYRNEEDERKDFHVFRNKSKDVKLKKKLLPSLYDKPEDEAEAAVDSSEKSGSEAVTVSAGKTESNVETVVVGKKRKRFVENKKKFSASSGPQMKKIKLNKNLSNNAASTKKFDNKQAARVGEKFNKKKNNSTSGKSASVLQVQKIAAAYRKGGGGGAGGAMKNKSKNKNQHTKNGDGGVTMSDDRLKAYGVNPKQMKRRIKSAKFRNKEPT